MADDFTQENRRLKITTPLGEDALLLTGLSGHEGISTLFSFDAELVGPHEGVDFDAIVGKNVTISILRGGGERLINGIVSRFSQSGTVGAHGSYHAQIVPWLWFLTRTTDCRIFQNKTVPDIAKQIFGEYGFADFKLSLHGSYPEWDYCVQYRESDFNFIARLFEEEGIFFFFKHEQGKHTLVAGDDPSEHKPCPGTSRLRFMHEFVAGAEEDVVTWFKKEQEVRAGKYTATDYNFETPSLDLAASASGSDARKYELYDFPGAGGSPAKRDRIEQLVRVREQEEDASRILLNGASYCRSLIAGFQFELAGEGAGSVSTFDGKYVLTSVRHRASESFGAGSDGAGLSYENDFECIPARVPFRPLRRTAKPVVNGVQTAVVVGPGGEEIFVDKYGRVKVQFFWDREGKRNDQSSCWIRVSQGWAGKNWGMVTIPRIGQEVVVSFVEGDPDCPIITGRVYNAEQMPPYDLPGNKTQSGIKTRSSLGGSPANFNEIRFEDKKGVEQLFIHAEKNEDIEVENDKTETVGNNETISIANDRSETVGANETLSVAKNRTRTVSQNEIVTVALTRTHTVGVNEAITVGGAQEVTVGAARAVTVGAAQSINVGGTQSVSVGRDQTTDVGGNQKLSVGANMSETVAKNRTLEIGKNLVIDAGDAITIKTGSASISMKKNGDITIEGNKIAIKGSSDITIKGSKITQN